MSLEPSIKIDSAAIALAQIRPALNRPLYRLTESLMPLIDRKLCRAALTTPALINHAERQTGLADWGENHEETSTALALLTRPRSDFAEMTGFGRMLYKKVLADRLINRLRIIDFVSHNPAVRQVEIRRPLLIVGLPRTGTSFLQQLLSADPNCLPLKSWYTDQVTPPPAVPPGFVNVRQIRHAAGIAYLNRLLPDLQSVHKISTNGVDECLPLLMNSMLTDAFALFADLPEYSAWLMDREMSGAYRFYRQQLQILQLGMSAGHWVLKSPAHLPHIKTLLEIFPDINIVHLHRDPLRSIPSLLSLRYKLLGLGNTLSQAGIAFLTEQSLKTVLQMLDKVTREREGLGNNRVLDVYYDDLIDNPQALCCQVLEYFRYEISPAYRQGLPSAPSAAEKKRRDRHHYSLEMFGLDAHSLGPLFSGYCHRFKVLREGR